MARIRTLLPRRIDSVRVRLLLSLGVVLGLGATSTLAYWTDQATVTGGTFTAGRLDLKVGTPGVDNDPADFSTSFTATNMQPGDSKAAQVAVRNAGTIDFKYAATATTSGALAPRLVFTVVPGGTVNGAGTACTGGTSTFGPASITSNPVIATDRIIATSGSETVCVVATLPTSQTGGQGESAQISFTFNARQLSQ